jgi:Resolvase, N terminal domain
VDQGLTGSNRDRPGLQLALAACRAGDTSVTTKLDRIARLLPDRLMGWRSLRVGSLVKCAPETLAGRCLLEITLPEQPPGFRGGQQRSLVVGARSGCDRCGCARPVGGLKQFDEVAGGVGEQDLASAGAGDNVAAE